MSEFFTKALDIDIDTYFWNKYYLGKVYFTYSDLEIAWANEGDETQKLLISWLWQK